MTPRCPHGAPLWACRDLIVDAPLVDEEPWTPPVDPRRKDRSRAGRIAALCLLVALIAGGLYAWRNA